MKWLARVTVALVALAIPLAAAEIWLRVHGSPSHEMLEDAHRLRRVLQRHEPGGYTAGPSGHRMELWGHEVRFNQLGMRDPEPRLPKPAGVRRVLIVGDSVTFGHGVGQEEMFAALLRERWRKRSIDVVSAARPGWNTVGQELFFEGWVDALDPDLMLVVYVINDRDPTPGLVKTPHPSPPVLEQIHRWLALRSRLVEEATFQYLKNFTDRMTEVLKDISKGRAHARKMTGEVWFADTDQGWVDSREAMLRMNQVMIDRGGKMVVYVYRINNRKHYRHYAHNLAEFGREADIEVVDSWPFFRGSHRPDLLINKWVDPHPNAKAHALIADGIEQHLTVMGWLDAVEH